MRASLTDSPTKMPIQESIVEENVVLIPMQVYVNIAPQTYHYYAKGEHLLRKYIHQMESDKARNVQTQGGRIHDAACLPYILDGLNAAGANIAYFPNTSSLLNSLSDLLKSPTLCARLQGILAQDGATSIGHHLYCDIYVDRGRASIIMVDSFKPSGMDQALFEHVDSFPNRLIVSYWDLRTQNSSANCLIFALSHAKKAIDEKDFLLERHKMQINNAVISAKPVWSINLREANKSYWDFLLKRLKRMPTPEDRNKYVMHYPLQNTGMLCVIKEGGEVFPERFFKHTESKKTLEKLRQFQPNLKLETKIVNKKNQTIFQRWNSYKTTRVVFKRIGNSTNYEVHKLTYSRSIEEKRLSFLRGALENVIKMQRNLKTDRH